MLGLDPTTLLDDLDDAQREAVTTTGGPLCILAGAGTGKTRVITRRVAYALAVGAVRPVDVLVVTFTDKAAGEMRSRLAAAGHPGISALTFHAAALRQLRHFWPRTVGGELPGIVESKARLLVPLATRLPGGYRYLAVRDLAAEIEWAKARRIAPARYAEAAPAEGHSGPLPADLMARFYRDYEAAKTRAGLIDFEDMLARTIELLETDATIAAEVRDRYRWFSVDEFQDTNPLQAALLEAWLGDRDDLAVVGDEDQTIYTFTGATSDHLTGFTRRFPSAKTVRLESNFRSTPEVLDLANRVLAAGRAAADERALGSAPRPTKRLVATLPAGPAPTVAGFDTAEDETAAVVARMQTLGRDGLPWPEMAILVRTNAQLPDLEAALGAAGVPFHVRGERFFGRPEVRRALRVAAGLDRPSARRVAEAAAPDASRLSDRLSVAFERELGVRRDDVPDGDAARERHAAVVTLLELADELTRRDPEADVGGFIEDIERRAAAEAGGASAGVELLTYHRAKGLEWSAVFLPALEEGSLPIRQASEPEELAEERRLLYVGITRARTHLWLSWARRRTGSSGRESRRARSRFLDGLVPAVVRQLPGPGPGTSARVARPSVGSGDRTPLSEALRAWRTARARADQVAPFIIFHDSTIEEIAARKPRSMPELRRVPGVGPTKLDRYGEEIIGVVVREG
ncbi:MAG TPA: ATP-dependent DNA helicase UvrD2 [Candidatus Saccharimonadales bacterium]|nr:ATP-dependent DNA helicase UvrD2 [Candidatus Saccharimonadales bacterium]